MVPPIISVLSQKSKFTINFNSGLTLRRRPRDDVAASDQKFRVAAKLARQNFFWNILQRIGQVDPARTNPKNHLQKNRSLQREFFSPQNWGSQKRYFLTLSYLSATHHPSNSALRPSNRARLQPSHSGANFV